MSKKFIREIAENIEVSGEKDIKSVMMKITDENILYINDSREQIKEKTGKNKKTFYPVCEGCREHIIGIIHIKDLLSNALSGNQIDLKECLHEPVYFTMDTTIHKAYDVFYQSKVGAAFVVDKENNVIGFVTLNDITRSFLEKLPCSLV